MQKRIALVTGGTRGIGAAISKRLANLGYQVIANYSRNHQQAEKFFSETRVPVMPFNVADYDACHGAITEITKTHGPISILVNNAGITRDGFFHKSTPEAWQEVIQTNLISCFNLCHLIVPGMRERSFGRIVNLSSINAQKGQLGQVNYSAAKAGIIGFTKSLALECANKGITVNAVAPGYIDTDMVRDVPEKVLQAIVAQIPVGRLGKPEDIAHTVGFLVGDDAGFITGAVVSANGGQYMG